MAASEMRSSRPSGRFFSMVLERDPVRAAEQDIRKYLILHGILAPPKCSSGKTYPTLFLLAIYAAIALVIYLGSLWLSRMECDPVFMDHGFSVACRSYAREVPRIIGSSTDIGTGLALSNVSQ